MEPKIGNVIFQIWKEYLSLSGFFIRQTWQIELPCSGCNNFPSWILY